MRFFKFGLSSVPFSLPWLTLHRVYDSSILFGFVFIAALPVFVIFGCQRRGEKILLVIMSGTSRMKRFGVTKIVARRR